MKTNRRTRIAALVLACLFLFSGAPSAFAADTDGIRCEKSAQALEDGTYRISLRAFQTGRVAPADIVMVLDVSGSMENSTPVEPDEIDPAKDYYIRFIRVVEIDGVQLNKQVSVRVHNVSAAGEEPQWYGQLEEGMPERLIRPGDGRNGTYRFYTGAMDALRQAAADFAQSIAQNAASYDADHRIAVVEFSSPEAKGTDALCTHTTQSDPYYANILTGDGTASGALVSAKDDLTQLGDVFASLTASGPTYSDDAMTQAQRILSASTASNRVAILFTDGGPGSFGWDYDRDETSLSTANAAIATAGEMKRSGVQIYTIGVFNDENRLGATGEKNSAYLSYVSSNYPDAESMENGGTQQADGYCSIGDLHMDLSGAFAGISAVLGKPVESAQVRDTVSRCFYLTDAQRQALLQSCPGAVITENEDGSTTVSLDAVDFPPVAIQADGTVVDPQDDGIFTMTFDVTPRDEFIGGAGVATNVGLCGVFVDGVQVAQFAAPQVDVPVREAALDALLQTHDKTLYAGQTLLAQDLYTNLSDSWAAQFAEVDYYVTDAGGTGFSECTMQTPGTQTFTVTVRARIDAQTVSLQKTTTVTVLEDTVDRIEIVTPPARTTYFVGQTVQLGGLTAYAWMCSGKAVRLSASELTVAPGMLTAAGTQTITIAYGGKTASFDVQVEAVKPVSATVSGPDDPVFTYKTTPDFTGLVVCVRYNDGHEEIVRDLSQMTIRADSSQRVRRGSQTFTVTTRGVTASFTMQPKLVWWQWLILICLFGWIWY